ncbi:MAG: hypothetical protein C4B59_01005 [Candidatus Methanogaster sp.]|uniref:Uncharacterized protein n=1 Tax=Candidatus Methanogaster sp. TaxID=3386292 RepID=A0AC61L6A9_9EURY|nr:MAG: hypothetical protein C4B59_01005 [ANME-2 cluster archaeon]
MGAKQYGLKCETFDNLWVYTFLRYDQKRQVQAWAEDFAQEVQTEDDGDEYMAETYPKSCPTERMVEGAGTKAARTLPLLRNEREHTIVAELLPPCRETCFQMDQSSQPEEKLQLGFSSTVFCNLTHSRSRRYINRCIPESVEDVLLKSRMREIFKSGSVRGLIVTSGLLPQTRGAL